MLLGRLGSGYSVALDGMRVLLRAAWAEFGGVELGTEGDSFYVVFPTAVGAVSAAVRGQRELGAFPWPGGERVRVRMGIHTGSPVEHDGAYVGMDVHRAARIAGSAHGGQVVVSESTAALVGEGLDGVRLRDLGAHQLKDIPVPEHLFQVLVEGLAVDFPPLKTLGTARSLPVPATVLVGRDGELAELVSALCSSGVRLVTLTGPGGTGKTRLAVGLADRVVGEFPDGVYFVPLATVTTAELMWAAMGEVLDVPPNGWAPPGFFAHVAQRSALVVLDNLEQVVGADTVVAELLSEAPRLTVVATSRRPLHVAAEHEHAVPPLELPVYDSIEVVARSGAVQLFVQQARKVRSGFALTIDNAAEVAAVCRRLDGLPLAVELAAARSKLLSPRALLARLGTALDIAVSGAQGPARQRTLRDTIAWSYELLTPGLQGFFRRVGVFAGGADLDAITAVTTSDGDPEAAVVDAFDLVAELVDASLVTVAEAADGEPRIGMLEMIRVYALDQLSTAGELAAARQRHARHYLGVLDRAHQVYAEDSTRFEDLIGREDANLTQAIGWAWAEEPAVAMHHLGALLWGWWCRDRHSDIRDWADRVLASGHGTPTERAQVMVVKLHVLAQRAVADPAGLQHLLETAEPVAETFDDEWHSRWVGFHAARARRRGDLDAALAWTEKFRLTTTLSRYVAAQHRAMNFAYLGRWQDAYDASAAALAGSPVRHYRTERIHVLASLGYDAVVLGRYDLAREHLDEALQLATRHDMLHARTLIEINLAWLDLATDEPARALTRVLFTLDQSGWESDPMMIIEALTIAGLALLHTGRTGDAHVLAVAALGVTKDRTDLLVDPYIRGGLETLLQGTRSAAPAGPQDHSLGHLIQLIRSGAGVGHPADNGSG